MYNVHCTYMQNGFPRLMTLFSIDTDALTSLASDLLLLEVSLEDSPRVLEDDSPVAEWTAWSICVALEEDRPRIESISV